MSGRCKASVKDKSIGGMRQCMNARAEGTEYCGTHLRQQKKPVTEARSVTVDKYKERAEADKLCLSYKDSDNCDLDEGCYWNEQAKECNSKKLPTSPSWSPRTSSAKPPVASRRRPPVAKRESPQRFGNIRCAKYTDSATCVGNECDWDEKLKKCYGVSVTPRMSPERPRMASPERPRMASPQRTKMASPRRPKMASPQRFGNIRCTKYTDSATCVENECDWDERSKKCYGRIVSQRMSSPKQMYE